MTDPDPALPVDKAAVEAAVKQFPDNIGKQINLARIITAAYKPRFAAERDVREELVVAAKYADCECDTYKGAIAICQRCTALAAAEKLEDVGTRDVTSASPG